ncbi:MAG: MATE family efflux transporter [Clostridiales bacterium]|nr:MAG: MATE family efflux transporter [Clostridiales bacterium]
MEGAVDQKKQSLLHDNIVNLMFKLSLPAIVGMFVIGLYSFVDAIFVGQWVNEVAVGAIAVAYPLTLLNNGIAVLVGIGSASVLSRAIGGDDQQTVDKIMGNLLTLVFILSLVTTVVGYFFTRQLLSFSRVEGDMLIYAMNYLKIIFLGSFFVNFAQAANMVMRGEGKMMIAMVIMAIGAILNIVLDPIFIKVLGYGIEGAAIATVIAQVVQFLITAIYFIKYSEKVRFKKIRLETSILSGVISVGVSAMLMQVLSLVQQTVLYSRLMTYGGEEKVILMGAIMRYMMLAFIPVWGISQGFQPVAGTNYGAKAYDRVKKSTTVFGIGATALALIFWLPFMLFTDTILSWFIKDNVAIITNGMFDARLAMLVFPIAGALIIFVTLFQAIGDAKKAGMLIMLRQAVLFIPLVYILPRIANLEARGAFASFGLTDLIVFAIAIVSTVKLFKVMGRQN